MVMLFTLNQPSYIHLLFILFFLWSYFSKEVKSGKKTINMPFGKIASIFDLPNAHGWERIISCGDKGEEHPLKLSWCFDTI